MSRRFERVLSKCRYLEQLAWPIDKEGNHPKEPRDKEALEAVHRLMSKGLCIRNLLNAFERAPGRRIGGWNGVAKQVKAREKAVVNVITAILGLKVRHFKDPQIDFETLWDLSEVVRSAEAAVDFHLRKYAEQRHSCPNAE